VGGWAVVVVAVMVVVVVVVLLHGVCQAPVHGHQCDHRRQKHAAAPHQVPRHRVISLGRCWRSRNSSASFRRKPAGEKNLSHVKSILQKKTNCSI
jgi:hypothetical protein